jgi:hypothetical protein
MAFIHEFFRRVVLLLSVLLPKLLHILIKTVFAIHKIDAEAKFVGRRHVVLFLKRRHVCRLHADDSVPLLFWRLRALRQPGRHIPLQGESIVGFQREFGALREKIGADRPIGTVNESVEEVVVEVILHNAAHLHVRHRERFRQISFRF